MNDDINNINPETENFGYLRDESNISGDITDSVPGEQVRQAHTENAYSQAQAGFTPVQNGYAHSQNDYVPPQNDYVPYQNSFESPQNEFVPPQNNYNAPAYNYGSSLPPQKKKAKKEKKPISRFGIIAAIICCSILSGIIGAGLTGLSGKLTKSRTTLTTGTHENTLVDVKNTETGTLMSASEVYAKNVNSTVGITTEVTTNYFGWKTSGAASGSGFIITKDGYILTNYHVIENSTSVTVTTYSNEKYTATIIGYDETNDLAVLKIDADNLTPVTIGNSENLNVGDDVVAIGNPLGELTFSLTKGTVSALNRDVTISSGYPMKLIQTDCAINSGNSGGALFNMYGEVIGITNAKYSSSSSDSASIDNIGFAIPMNSVTDTVKSIIETGTVTRNYSGITVSDLSAIYRYYGLSSGAIVTAVDSDSPAEKAGFKVQDIILAINSEKCSEASDVEAAVIGAQEGDKLTFTVYRSGEKMELTLTVEKRAVSAAYSGSTSSSSDYSENDFGSFFNWF